MEFKQVSGPTTQSRGATSAKSQTGSINKASSRITGRGSVNNYHPQLPKVLSGSSQLTTGTVPRSATGAVYAVSAPGHSAKYGSRKKGSAAQGAASGQPKHSGASGAAASNASLAGRPAHSTSGQSAVAGFGVANQGANPVHAPITYHPSQLPPDLSKKLKKFLLTIKNGEQSIETQRQRLCAIETFEPLSAFQRLDRNQDMQLAPLEIVRFLRENGIENISEADCSNMISYYKGQMSEQEVQLTLGFRDFLAIVVPLESPVLKE